MSAVEPFDPIKLAKEVEKVVTRGELRRYYRAARPGRWYGGIATADSHRPAMLRMLPEMRILLERSP